MWRNKNIQWLFLALIISLLFHSVFFLNFRPRLEVKPYYFNIYYWGSFLTLADVKSSPNPKKSLFLRRKHVGVLQKSKILSWGKMPSSFASVHPLSFSFRDRGGSVLNDKTIIISPSKDIIVDAYNKHISRFLNEYAERLPEFYGLPFFLAADKPFLVYVPEEERHYLHRLASEVVRREYFSSRSGKIINIKALVSPLGKIVFVKFTNCFSSVEGYFSLYYWLQGLIFEGEGKREWINLQIDLHHAQM